jgi:ketosteroid isomerase-like protein
MSPDGEKWVPWLAGKMTRVSTQESEIEKQILKLEHSWAAAVVKRDSEALGRLLAPEVTSGSPEGKWLDKAAMLADIKSGDYVASSVSLGDMKVRLFGDIAVITGVATEQSRYKGTDASGQYIWTDTWQKRDGMWTCIATHASKVGTKIGQ